jgi:two-component system, NtrC family, nitrogen regulation sensor histidine kinase NtrY
MLSFRILFSLIVSILLIVVGLLSHSNFKNGFSEVQIAERVSKNLHRQLQRVEQEAEQLLDQHKNQIDQRPMPEMFFLMDSSQVLTWGKNDFVPDPILLKDHFAIKFLKSQRGDFVIRKWMMDSSRFLIAVIPLFQKYTIINRYLQPKWNESIFPLNGVQLMDISSPKGSTVCLATGCLFKLLAEEPSLSYPTDNVSIALTGAGFLFLFTSVLLLVARAHRDGKYGVAFLIGTTFLLAIRVIMVKIGFPIQWGKLSLFDPQQFASSAFNVSLGDFILNSLVVLLASAYLFANYARLKVFKRLLLTRKPFKLMGAILLLTLAIFAFLYPFLFFEIIFHNSSITLDITQQLSFDANRFWAFVTILVGSVSSFVFCHFLFRMAASLLGRNHFQFVFSLLIAIILFSLYCWAEQHDYTITLVVAVGYFVVVYLLTLYKTFSRIGFATFFYLLVAIAAYSTQAALSIRNFSLEATKLAQFRFANSNLVNHDVLGEYLLGAAIKKISSDPFVQSRFSNPLLPKGAIRQRVKQIYLSSYFDRYTSEVYLFNSSGEPLNNQSQQNFSTSIQAIESAAIKTEYESVYRIAERAGGFIRRYLGVVKVVKENISVGFILLDLSSKSVLPQSVYPELLVDNRFSQFVSGQDFSYAFFSKDKLVSSFGYYNYKRKFHSDLLVALLASKESIQYDGFIHTVVGGESGEIAVVTSAAFPFFGILANFSFHFVLGLFMILIWMLVYLIISFWRGVHLNYATRIQLYIYLAFILPLIVVSAVTVSLISNSNENQIESDLRLRAQQLAQGITRYMEQSLDTVTARNDMESYLVQLSKSTNVDINIYSPFGQLVASSQPDIFTNQLLPNLMNRDAWQRLVKENESYLVNKEKIGLLGFNNSYLAINHPATGKLMAILNLPFFKSIDQIDKSQASVLGNILVIFVGVFLLFSFLSYYAVSWLTFPLRLITKTLRATTLGANNYLQWKSDDEIGLMVSEYNRMVENLEASRMLLARTQKESAWREMAQQVAHEIKNPLTPMRLTLQQMELSSNGDQKKLTSIKMLLQQVDILTDIASSFSTFAKMPLPELISLNIVNVLKSVVSLYGNHPSGSVVLNGTLDPIFVLGDEQLMSRVFSNIILNGLQSGEDDVKVLVQVSVTTRWDRCVINFSDNGRGIPLDARDRVFTPYFSTKKSGSGLGLAIAKQGIEQCGGKIDFESEVGKGTVFKVELVMEK